MLQFQKMQLQLNVKLEFLNPDYDASKKDSYETRESRKEWFMSV